MTAPFRVYSRPTGIKSVATHGRTDEELRFYVQRLIKLIPAEVVGLYLCGNGFIPNEYHIAHILWSCVCLVAVLVVRVWGTSDPEYGQGPQWLGVLISSLAFVIWLYTIGGPFALYGIQIPWLGSLLVLSFTFFVPYFYKGSAEPTGNRPPRHRK
jgi:hypothetical protein